MFRKSKATKVVVEEVQEVTVPQTNVVYHTERWGDDVNLNVSQPLPSLDD